MKRILLLCVFAVLQCGHLYADDLGTKFQAEFVEQVRSLLLLEDTIASGNRESPALVEKLLRKLVAGQPPIPPADAAPPPSLSDAVLGLTLSGGPPIFAKEMLGNTHVTAIQRQMLEGALAFAQGDRAKAARYLDGVDALRLPPSIGGRVALVQAIVLPDTEEAKRQRLFAIAAALMPGTLVEEAAERRAAIAAARGRDYVRMWNIAEHYIVRLGASLYAPRFLDSLVQATGDMREEEFLADRANIEALLNHLAREDRVLRYLSIAQQETANGRKAAVQFAAARAMREAAPGSPAWQKARLYTAAWAIAGDRYETAVNALRIVEPEYLDKNEGDLLNAAIDIGLQIRSVASEPPHLESPLPAKLELTDEQAQVEASARIALNAAEGTLTAANSQ